MSNATEHSSSTPITSSASLNHNNSSRDLAPIRRVNSRTPSSSLNVARLQRSINRTRRGGPEPTWKPRSRPSSGETLTCDYTSPSSSTTSIEGAVLAPVVTPFWRLVFFALLAIQLGGAVCLIVLAQHREVDDTNARNAERFESAKSTLLSDIHDVFSNLDALVQHWRYVIPFVPSMEQFDLIFNRDAFPFDIIWLPHVLHAQRAAFEAATYDDISSFFNTSAVPHNITALVFNGSITVGQEISPDKESYYPVRFTAPPLPPNFYLRDSASESVRSSIVDAIVDARGESVVGERLLSYSGGTVNAISTLSAAAMSPTNTSHVLGIFAAYIRWQLFVPAQITTPTAGSTHMRIFDLTPTTDGCATPLLFSGTHNDDGSWTLAPPLELQQCSSAYPKLSHSIALSGHSFQVEFTKAPGFDENVDTTQLILDSVFLLVTIAMLLFIIATGWFIVQHMKRTATTTAKYVEELTVAEQEARESKEHRDQFLAFLSHELRNPLFGLRGTIDESVEHVAVQPVPEPLSSHLHTTFATLHDCTQQIERTLNTVVNVQNMTKGKLDLYSAPFRTSSLIDKLRTRVAGRMAVRQVELQVSVAPDVPDMLLGDFERILEAVGHLLRNAVEYSPRLGTVTFRVEVRPTSSLSPASKRKRLRSVRIGPSPHEYQHEFVTSKPKATDDGRVALQFVVVDKGPGLMLRQIKRVFQPYTRERIARASQGRGSNLGLPVAQLLCKQMDGFVRVRSGPGQGSEFTAAMQLRVAPNDVEHPATPHSVGSLASHQPSIVDVPTLRGRFLVVDDQKINRRLVSRILSKLMPEATVDVAEDGLDAVEKVAAAGAAGAPYSCIFMDIQMPRMSGTQATRQLRQNGFSKPIIAVTGGTLEEEIAKYLRAGMVGVIHKPCKKADFEAMLQEHWHAVVPDDRV